MKKHYKWIAILLCVCITFSVPLYVSAFEVTRSSTIDITQSARIVTIDDIDGRNITLSNGGTRTITPRVGQRLNNGNIVATGQETIAQLRLDIASILQMDEQSRVMIASRGRQLSVMLQSGNALINVAEQAEGDIVECRVGAIGLEIRGTMFTMGRDNMDITTIVMLSGYGKVHIGGYHDAILLPAGSMMWVFDTIHDPDYIYNRALETRFYSLDQGHDEVVNHAAVIEQLVPKEMNLFTLQAVWDNQEYLLDVGTITPKLLSEVGDILGIEAVLVAPSTPEPEPTQTPMPIIPRPTPPTPPIISPSGLNIL